MPQQQNIYPELSLSVFLLYGIPERLKKRVKPGKSIDHYVRMVKLDDALEKAWSFFGRNEAAIFRAGAAGRTAGRGGCGPRGARRPAGSSTPATRTVRRLDWFMGILPRFRAHCSRAGRAEATAKTVPQKSCAGACFAPAQDYGSSRPRRPRVRIRWMLFGARK